MAAITKIGKILWTERTPPQKAVVLSLTLLALFIITAAICHATKVNPFKAPELLRLIQSHVKTTCFIAVIVASGLGALWYFPVKKKGTTPPEPAAAPPQLGLPQRLGQGAVQNNMDHF